ncbi:cell wall-binding repeat-containing protein [Haloimpatiens sp. FM7330]|uniref:cell wall-binding repeat-containing protein n=1 Tax=Haloimpatiens sp. FM7330 TaxID=3298610 RepID=UPI0036360C93
MRRFSTVMVLAVFLLVLKTTIVQAVANEVRLGGINRYETSIEVSVNHWSQSDNVILVSGRDFPDALSASPLSKKYDAPILLTEKQDIPSNILNEIKRLKAKNVYIIGGTGVVDINVENMLKNIGINVIRIAGKDRYETSIEVAKMIGNVDNVVIASGQSFPDALSIASIAAAKQIPILLTGKNSLPTDTLRFMNDNNINQGYIVGGTGVVSTDISNKLKGFKRLAGKDRFATNLAVITEFINDLDYGNVFIATASDYPDALSGSGGAAKINSPIFLTNGITQIKNSNFLEKLKTTENLKVLGSSGVVSKTAVQRLVLNVYSNNVFEFKEYSNTLQYYINRQFTEGFNVDYGRGEVTLEKLAYYMNPSNFENHDQGKYMFLRLNYRDGISLNDLDKILSTKGILKNRGQVYMTAGQKHNVNPIYLVAHSLLETGNGTSNLANGILVSSVDGQPVQPKVVYNVYAAGAYDANADKYGAEFAYKNGWFTVNDAIIGGAEFISKGYINSYRQQDTLYKMKWDLANVWHEYATDIGWAYKQTYIIKQVVEQTENSVLYFEIPVFK